MATSGISFSGLASGLNSSQIIEALLSVDQSRMEALKAQKIDITTRVSGIGTLKSKLNTVVTKLNALRFDNQVMARTATSSNATGATATATSAAAFGSFDVTVTQLATATRRFGAVGAGQESFDETAALASSGWLSTPTAGRFTINGVAIDVAAPTKIQDFVDAINAAEPTTGVTADYVLDGGGNKVGIRLYNTDLSATPIQAGTAGDTSNFLSAAKLTTATQAGHELLSTTTLGRVIASNVIDTARLANAFTAGAGTFTVNGVSISYNTATESINSLIGKINSSTANVTASYDAITNRLMFQSKSTGSQSITVADTAGDLMAALGATNAAGATETLGLNAKYSVSTVAGGAEQQSNSNNVTGVVAGVTLNLLKQGETATVTVGQDVEKPLAAMKEFVTAFNDAMEYISTNSKPDAAGKPGLLQRESTVRMIGDTLRGLIYNTVSGLSGPYSSLVDLGVSNGAVGSAVGTTSKMMLDETKFKDALAANPGAVQDVLNKPDVGSEGIFQRLRTYIDAATLGSGLLSSITNGATSRQADLDARIKASERRIEQKRERLELQFARMEGAIAALQAQGQRLNQQISNMQQATGQ